MDTTDMNKNEEKRRGFLRVGLVVFAGLMAGGWFGRRKKNTPQPSGVKLKMLAPDGTLVEIDRAYIRKRKRLSGKEILQWMSDNGMRRG